MLKLSTILTFLAIMCFDPSRGDIQGTQKQLLNDVNAIKKEKLDNFELRSNSQSALQKDENLKEMMPPNRKQLEEVLYDTFVGICNRKNIKPCHHFDVKFFADLLAKGDPNCIATCSKDKMLKNKDKVPNGEKTIAFIEAIHIYMKDLDENNKDDKSALTDIFQQGCDAVGTSNCTQKRASSLPFIPVAIGLVKRAGIVAGNFITEMSKSQSTKYLYTGNSFNQQDVRPTRRRRRGCFSADSLVNVKTNTGDVVSSPLRSLNLGDVVESVDEQTGQRIYSKIYYIEHEQQDSHARLLRILYADRFNATQSLGISDRHLIYATKKGQSTAHAPLNEPIMAMEVEEGDVVWIMEDGKLVPSKVTGVMPYHGAVRHPLTENHHVIVDGVHASVHILNEQLYRRLTYPLRWTFWANPEWNRSWIVKKLVRVVQNGKEPFFTSSPTELMEYWSGSALPGLFSSPISY